MSVSRHILLIKDTETDSTQKKQLLTSIISLVEKTYYKNGGTDKNFKTKYCLTFIKAMGRLMNNKSGSECMKPCEVTYFDEGNGKKGIDVYYLGWTTTITL
jgi:hypothetical protein